jgi:hypothetical protein
MKQNHQIQQSHWPEKNNSSGLHTHNPILPNIENNGPFQGPTISIDSLTFSQIYQTLLHI